VKKGGNTESVVDIIAETGKDICGKGSRGVRGWRRREMGGQPGSAKYNSSNHPRQKRKGGENRDAKGSVCGSWCGDRNRKEKKTDMLSLFFRGGGSKSENRRVPSWWGFDKPT